MIGFLEGTAMCPEDGSTIICCGGGVGYEITMPAKDREGFIEGAHVARWVRAIYRETSTDLYGFLWLPDRQFFDDVTAVTSFGPSAAMALIDGVGAAAARVYIKAGNAAGLRCEGIGAKSAQKLIDNWKVKR